MRRIDEIIIHCSATPAGRRVSVAQIDRWHRERGFNQIGYHYIIQPDGSVEAGRSVELPGAHCKGHNQRSIGVCYIGGLDGKMRPADTRTDAQRGAMRKLVWELLARYPGATVHGHNEFARKDCPCFNVRKEFGHA